MIRMFLGVRECKSDKQYVTYYLIHVLPLIETALDSRILIFILGELSKRVAVGNRAKMVSGSYILVQQGHIQQDQSVLFAWLNHRMFHTTTCPMLEVPKIEFIQN